MSRHRILTVVLLALATPALAAQSDTMSKSTSEVLPFESVEKTLPNGLKVLVVPTPFPNLVSLYINVRTGSRNEVEPGKSGFAHFFEHMMFRGTEKFPNERYQEILTKAGASNNANTWDDRTIYHMTFAKDDLETMLMLEADRFQNLAYSVEDFKTEARAVLGEYNKNSANPISKLFEVQRDTAYRVHTYKHTTMGFLRDIEDMPNQYEYSKTFFDRWYRPEYTTVMVLGDVDPQRTIELVEKHWAGWERGDYRVEVPAEPAPGGPEYAHVAWESQTIPWVTVAFHAPAFAEKPKEFAALDVLLSLWFGPTSDLYKKLVEQEQVVDSLSAFYPPREDSTLATILSRVKKTDDAKYVRDEILKTVAKARTEPVERQKLEDAKSNARYGLAAGLDNTDAIADLLAEFAHYERAPIATINRLYRTAETLTPEDLLAAAKSTFTDARLVVTTLSHGELPRETSTIPAIDSLAPPPATGAGELKLIVRKTQLPQLNVKLLFDVGSAHDPEGKEGLAMLAASMVSEAGSKAMRIDEITRALFPIAGRFGAQVDREMTTFTGSIHRDNWERFFDIVLPQLLDPGYRQEDFERLKDAQKNALIQNLRANNDEELGKERLQYQVFRGTPYAHPPVGTEAGIDSITLDDVRELIRSHYARGNLVIGLAGDVPDGLEARLRAEMAKLPAGATPAPKVSPRRPEGLVVEIVDKPTRAVAISLGFPIEVTRAHPDFPALSVARAWLGEHRSSMSHLYQRIRETRGMNYGDYAYIEAFPRGMFRFYPDPNIARSAQIFEIWIRPVVPVNAHMALRIATHELEKLVRDGLTREQFETAREYLTKNVYVLTSTQNQQLGYALDSDWYGIPEYTRYMRDALSKLTRQDVNRAIRKHLQANSAFVVIIADDAEGLKDALVSDRFSPIEYDADKPAELLAEDKAIGARKLDIDPSDVTITPVDEVFRE
ncbi:MAG TPA: pitrilysin family protein [Thermoanaerobaculia bacterium]|nr:pitrilysin family protein [Thermoanaerobaculia bacterium]